MKLEDHQAALDAFERALEMARVQGDKKAEKAIKRAIDDVNKEIVKNEREKGREKDVEGKKRT